MKINELAKKKAVPSKQRDPGALATRAHISSQEKKHADWAEKQRELEKQFYANHPELDDNQGVAEGLKQTLRRVVPGYAKREIDRKMDAGKFGKTDADKDANFQRYKKIQDKITGKGVTEMDSQGYKGTRDEGDPYAKGNKATPVKSKNVAKQAAKALYKAMSKSHPDYSKHEKKLISKMSNAEKADKGWRNPNIDEVSDNSKFVGFMNKAMANKVDAPKADPLAKAPDWYKNAPAMNFDAMPSHKEALQFGLKVLSKLDSETKQQLAAGGERAICDYIQDVAERKLGSRGTIDFVEEDIWECQDYLSNVFHDPDITSWVDVLKTGLNEVSDQTLINYLTKVDADAQKHRSDPTKRSPEKASRSVAGFSRAFNKLDARKATELAPRVGESTEEDRQRYEQAARDVVKGADPDHIARVRKLDAETLRRHVDHAWERVNSGEYKLNRPNLEETDLESVVNAQQGGMPLVDVNEARESCPECGGPMFPALVLGEKQDACYYKVKSRYKVWPSAYASGALVQCRKKGAANWGNKGK